jgi:hypothetical protein
VRTADEKECKNLFENRGKKREGEREIEMEME